MKYIIIILCAFGFLTIFGLIVQIFTPLQDSNFYRYCAPVSWLIGALMAIDYINSLQSKNK